jgi:hypothetical protein
MYSIRSRRTTVNTNIGTLKARERLRSILTLLVAMALALSALTLVGCGGSSAEEQDNCYGEDMPVINE